MTADEFRQQRAERLEAVADARQTRILLPPLKLVKSRDGVTVGVAWHERFDTQKVET